MTLPRPEEEAKHVVERCGLGGRLKGDLFVAIARAVRRGMSAVHAWHLEQAEPVKRDEIEKRYRKEMEGKINI